MSSFNKEHFWGCVLSSACSNASWKYNNGTAESDNEDEDPDFLNHSLYVKQAILGTGAKPGQRNLVEVETTDYDGIIIKNVIFTLISGSSEQFATDIGFFAPTTFRLIEGDGPVHLSGCHMVDISFDDDQSDEEEDDELKREESAAELNALGKRKAADTHQGKKAKVLKVDKAVKEHQKNGGGDFYEEEDSDEEDDDDEEADNTKNDSIENMEDEEFEEDESDEPTPEKKPKGRPGKAASKEKVKPVTSEPPKKKKGKSLEDSPAKKTAKVGKEAAKKGKK